VKTAVIGMGRMGAALALRLLAGGHEVLVWNRTPGRAPEVVAAGAREAGSLAAAVAGAQAVLTSLSDDAAVREVALGAGGLAASLPGDAVYVECSTVSPALTEELARTFPSFVAMPVLGGPASVESAQATYLAGGAPDVLARLEPLFGSLGGGLRRYGSPGLASTAKLAVNLLMLSGIVALAESVTVGRSGGLSDDQLRELLGGAVAPGVKNRFEAVLGAPASGWWSTLLGAKDARLAVELAENAGARLVVAGCVREAYVETARRGYGQEDVAAVRHLYGA
jgi:3-hydroxyisobutyrate dehydrogenase-like beta-hydroxyacid dehydrogenase